jgi:hypothetical protein
VATIAVVLAVLCGGCGGRGDYSLAPTRSCLEGKGASIGGRLDFVATTALEGAFVARVGDGNSVTLVFGDGEKNAEELENAYHRFALPNVREGLSDVLRRDRNVVMRWHAHPEDADLATISGCLK